MNTIKSFIKQFIAIVNGDDAAARAEKVFRQAESALKAHIAALTGDVITLEDKVTESQERLENALVNNGESITNRTLYVENLIKAESAVKKAEEELEEHKDLIDFLSKKLQQLSEEVAA